MLSYPGKILIGKYENMSREWFCYEWSAKMILEKAHLCVISNLILQTLVVWRV